MKHHGFDSSVGHGLVHARNHLCDEQACGLLPGRIPSQTLTKPRIIRFKPGQRDGIERIRDFVVLHHQVTGRNHTPFWRGCRSLDTPASLRHRIQLFRDAARVFRKCNELSAENSGIQLMLSQGSTGP